MPQDWTSLVSLYRHDAPLSSGKEDLKTKKAKQVGQQFEALFYKMMLKSMRKAMPQSSFFNSSGTRMFTEMFDTQISKTLSEQGNLGISDMIEKNVAARESSKEHSKPKEITYSKFTWGAAPTLETNKNTLQQVELNNIIPVKQVFKPAEAQQETINAKKTSPLKAEAADSKLATITDSETPKTFIQKIWPYAKVAAQTLGVNPMVLTAQAALETGWGKFVPERDEGESSHNVFGIKSKNEQASVQHTTQEFIDGKMENVKDGFRVFDNLNETFDAYISLMRGDRYAAVKEAGQNPVKQAQALQESGYATDPDYAKKIIDIVSRPAFQQTVAEVEAQMQP
ncbi:MAG: flagellar assembly peptidoglycan hydrolase FlgJ [bacterium]